MPLIKNLVYNSLWWWCGLIQTGDAGQNGERGQPGLPGLKGDHGLRGPQGPRGKWCNCSLQFALDVLVLDCYIHSNILTTLIHWTRSLRDPDYNSGHSTKSYSYLLYASVYSIRSFRQIRFTILVMVRVTRLSRLFRRDTDMQLGGWVGVCLSQPVLYQND